MTRDRVCARLRAVKAPRYRSAPAWLLLSGLLAGCAGGTETGNPPLEGKLSYAAYSTEPAAVGVRSTGSTTTVEAVWLDLGDVRFNPGTECDGSEPGAVVAPGIGVGDHASGKPVSTRFSPEPGAYCAVSLALKRSGPPPVDAPPELAGASVLLLGVFEPGTPFSIRSELEGSVVLLPAAAGGFSLSQGSAAALLGFDVAAWLAGLDFAAANVTSGSIAVDSSTNTALLEHFEQNLKAGVTLFRDAEGDGVLDQDAVVLAD
jgi:hypothetical protein